MRTAHRAAAALTLMVLGFVGPASAATNTATIAQAAVSQATLSGRVTDSRGNALGGATVTAQGAGATLTAKTAGDGTFSLTAQPGIYTVSVSRGGYQTVQTDSVAVVAGSTVNIGQLTLTELSTQSLRTIGRVSTTASRNPVSTNVAAVTTLSGAAIEERVPTNLNDVVQELPGISVARTSGATANTFFETRGFFIQQKVNIDGHPVASGQFGNWNSAYANPFIFGQVEVLKGAGLNGPTAGETAIGTINLRTRDFTSKNAFEATAGIDSYQGSYLNVFGSVNLLKNDKLSILAARASSGYNGPWNDVFANRVGTVNGLPTGTYQVPSPNGLVLWQGDLSNKYGLQAELAKARYRFSESTSLTFEYLGLQGQYFPQGGAYASYYGHVNVGYCANKGAVTFNAAQCNAFSTYGAPYTAGLAGQTVDAYSWFPNSYVQNNEPQFSAELRTTFKNDTLLLRPYTAEINRFINGQYEVNYPGNGGSFGGGWYQVTNAANCQVAFSGPNAATGAGAKGPCFGSAAQYNSPAYIGADTTTHTFATTGVAPVCSAATPCWTTNTAQSNDGSWAYGTPFSQPEVDYLHGFTLSYLHPVGDNVYNFSWDYNLENSTFNTGDTNKAPAGCAYVIGSGFKNDPTKPYYQPNCPLPFLPKTSIGYAPTNIRKNDFSLTGLFQVTPKLQVAFGNYLTVYSPDAQVENPQTLAAFTAQGIPGAAPLDLVHTGTSYTHYDPHLGLNYRVSRDASLRFTGGSSVTLPFASVISGIDRVDLPNGSNSQTYTLTQANPGLRPETQVSYDLGGDVRLHDGGLFSADAYNITIFDAFAANNAPLTGSDLALAQSLYPTADVSKGGGGYYRNQTINVGQLRAYGLELSFAKSPVVGWGYRLTGSLERAYFDKIPASVYLGSPSSLVNGKQLDGLNGSIAVPFAKAYGELRYGWSREGLFTLGADYEGSNNSTYGPPFTTFNSTLRLPIAGVGALQIAADNLFNLSTGTGLGRALQSQGSQSIRYGCNAVGANCGYSASPKSLQMIYPRNVRIQLSRRF